VMTAAFSCPKSGTQSAKMARVQGVRDDMRDLPVRLVVRDESIANPTSCPRRLRRF